MSSGYISRESTEVQPISFRIALQGVSIWPPWITTITNHENIKKDWCIVLLLGTIPVLKWSFLVLYSKSYRVLKSREVLRPLPAVSIQRTYGLYLCRPLHEQYLRTLSLSKKRTTNIVSTPLSSQVRGSRTERSLRARRCFPGAQTSLLDIGQGR